MSQLKVVVVADDLTGALDSAVAFAVRGLRTVCARTVEDLEQAMDLKASVVAVSTGSRELEATDAVARVVWVREWLQRHPAGSEAVLFKKVDSRLKGHVAAETAALRRSGQPLVVCPAIPRLGRWVIRGAVTGAGVAQPIPVAPRVGVPEEVVLDAASDPQLDAGLAQAPAGALLVGAAGLAEALARTLVPEQEAPTVPVLSAPALLAIGSRDPVTLAQLPHLEVIPAPNGVVPDPWPPTGTYQLVQLTPGTQPQPAADVGDAFTRGVARWVEVTQPATLILSGGETASAVLARLGIGTLEVQGELLPGLPYCRALEGRPGLGLITKSGGFGPPQTLTDVVRALVEPAGPDFGELNEN